MLVRASIKDQKEKRQFCFIGQVKNWLFIFICNGICQVTLAAFGKALIWDFLNFERETNNWLKSERKHVQNWQTIWSNYTDTPGTT